jgi:hypothetical protein
MSWLISGLMIHGVRVSRMSPVFSDRATNRGTVFRTFSKDSQSNWKKRMIRRKIQIWIRNGYFPDFITAVKRLMGFTGIRGDFHQK